MTNRDKIQALNDIQTECERDRVFYEDLAGKNCHNPLFQSWCFDMIQSSDERSEHARRELYDLGAVT